MENTGAWIVYRVYKTIFRLPWLVDQVAHMNDYIYFLIGLVLGIFVPVIIAFALAGFDASKLRLARTAFFRVAKDADFAAKVNLLLNPPPPEPPKPVKPDGRPVRLLALLQREGRLLDFLLEDIQGLPDAQIGAAVRDIHRQSQAALKEHVVLEPVMTQPESSTVEVPTGFDPSAIRLTGNVTGQPPFRGTLQHHGWRVKEIKLAPPPEGQDELVLMPAEVELP
jgi:hypothetical protein